MKFAEVGSRIVLKGIQGVWTVAAAYSVQGRDYLDAQRAADKRWQSVIRS